MVDDERLKRWVEQKLEEGIAEERIKKSLENTGNDPSIVDRVKDPFTNEGQEGMEEPVEDAGRHPTERGTEDTRPSRPEFGGSDLQEKSPDTGERGEGTETGQSADEGRGDEEGSFEPERDTDDFSFDTGTGQETGARDPGSGAARSNQRSGRPDRDLSGRAGDGQEQDSGGFSMPSISVPSVSAPSVPLKRVAIALVALLVVGGGVYGFSSGMLSVSSLSVPAVQLPSVGGEDKSADSSPGGAASKGECSVGTRINAVSTRGTTTTAQVTVSRGEAEVVLEVFEDGSLVDSSSKVMSGEGEISVDAKGDRVVFRQTGCTEFKDSVRIG